MNTFIYHENASGKASFTKTGDAWSADSDLGIFAVADSPLRCLVRDTKEYPFDDNGYEAADTFCQSFQRYGKEFLDDTNRDEDGFRQVLIQCNKEVANLNKRLNKDFKDPLNYDLAETVGIGAIICDDHLYYGGLEDCYLNVLRGVELENIAKWQYQIVKAAKYIDRLSERNELAQYIPKELVGKIKKENEWEPVWCNHLRNNPDALDENVEAIGWGCFTGEVEAESFIQTYSLELKTGDHILLFSDGMIPVLENDEFVAWFLQNHSNSFYFQLEIRQKIQQLLAGSDDADKEKTLIYVKR